MDGGILVHEMRGIAIRKILFDSGQGGADNLIHIIVAILSKSANKNYVWFSIGKSFVFLIELFIFLARDRVVRIAFGLWIFTND